MEQRNSVEKMKKVHGGVWYIRYMEIQGRISTERANKLIKYLRKRRKRNAKKRQ